VTIRGKRVALCVAAVSVALTAACTSTVSGEAVPGEIDIRTLDVGSYSTDKSKIFDSLLESEPPILEAVRLADAVVSPYEVDHKYVYGLGGKLEMNPDDVTLQLPAFMKPIVAKFGMVMAVRTAAADASIGDGKTFENGAFEGLTATIIRFPDHAAAKSAAAEMDAADFAWSPDNVAVELPDISDALAHWRPMVPTIGVIVPHGEFVIAVYAGRHTVDKNALIAMVTKYIAEQTNRLDQFRPTPVSDFKTLKQDPDEMLVRMLQPYGTISGPSPESDIVLTPRGFSIFQSDIAGRAQMMDRFGVDRVAASQGRFLFRTRDSQAARAFLADAATVLDKDKQKKKELGPAPGLPESKCLEYSSPSSPSATKYNCYVAYRRYVAMVKSDQLIDVRQQAAAQYAVLANNQ
jgi:hypothetical protein